MSKQHTVLVHNGVCLQNLVPVVALAVCGMLMVDAKSVSIRKPRRILPKLPQPPVPGIVGHTPKKTGSASQLADKLIKLIQDPHLASDITKAQRAIELAVEISSLIDKMESKKEQSGADRRHQQVPGQQRTAHAVNASGGTEDDIGALLKLYKAIKGRRPTAGSSVIFDEGLGAILNQLKTAIEPVLVSYQQEIRSQLRPISKTNEEKPKPNRHNKLLKRALLNATIASQRSSGQAGGPSGRTQ